MRVEIAKKKKSEKIECVKYLKQICEFEESGVNFGDSETWYFGLTSSK